MKIISNLETTLLQHHMTYHLPHLAIELDVKYADCVEDGIELRFNNHLFNLSAIVFRPGDGSRFILKNFTIEYTVSLAPSWWQKLLSLCLVKNIIYWTKSYKTISEDITHFLKTSEKHLLHLGKVLESPLKNQKTD